MFSARIHGADFRRSEWSRGVCPDAAGCRRRQGDRKLCAHHRSFWRILVYPSTISHSFSFCPFLISSIRDHFCIRPISSYPYIDLCSFFIISLLPAVMLHISLPHVRFHISSSCVLFVACFSCLKRLATLFCSWWLWRFVRGYLFFLAVEETDGTDMCRREWSR
jgi:hypothetical protein